MKMLQVTLQLLIAITTAFFTACQKPASAPGNDSSSASSPAATTTTTTIATVRELATPAAENSGEPELFVASDGQIILSWIEKTAEKRHALRFATKNGDRWSEPLTIAEGSDWFVNWADFPSVVKLSDNSLAAHWLVKSAQSKYAYDVLIARSNDGGQTWTPPIRPHRDGTPTEHGFVSLVPLSNGALAAVWLDGRKFQTKEQAYTGEARMINVLHGDAKNHATSHDKRTNEMTLRYATINADGTLDEEAELDERVCECCQTTAALTADGLIVVYRDRSEKEVRDFSFVRRLPGGEWTAPRTLHEDDWEIKACPVNGASVAAQNRRVAVAWFTASHNTPQVKVSFSADSGATFNQPVRVDDGTALGRVDIILLDDGATALVSWLEGTTQGGKIKARRISSDGTPSDVITIAETNINRASGFPRMARFGNDVVFAWTDAASTAAAKAPRIRTAIASFAK